MKYERWYSLVEKSLKERYSEDYPPIIAFFELDSYYPKLSYIKPNEAADMIANKYINELENFEVINGR